MRKFIRVFIIIVLFFSCLFVGVYLAEFSDTENPPSLNSFDLENSNQINVLVFVVNKLEESKSELLSAWSIILYYPNPGGMMMVPLSSSTEANFNEITRNFRLDSRNVPNSKTEKYFEETFDAQWDATVVMDLHSVQLFTNWISKGEYTFNLSDEIINPQDSGNKYGSEKEFCNLISKKLLPQWELLDSDAISEDHFFSQNSIEDLKIIWLKLITGNSPKCEVILLENGN